MNVRALSAVAAIAALAIAPVRSSLAMSTKPEPPPSSPSSMPSPPPDAQSASAASGARQEAERDYALAYDDLAKAKKDWDDGKSKNAEKKFRKVLERVENAVYLDSTYAEAWNLVGYAARRLGDYDKAFGAYDHALSLKPDFAAAHEYLGEAWLEKGDLAKSRDQLAILQKLNADSDEFKALGTAIDSYVAAHPSAASSEPATAKADTTSSH